MKVLILYRPNSEHATTVESFVRDFQHQHDMGDKVECVSVNTREGAATASNMLWHSPQSWHWEMMAVRSMIWQGEPLPLMDEVAGYVYA
jgi:hypothetical protein